MVKIVPTKFWLKIYNSPSILKNLKLHLSFEMFLKFWNKSLQDDTVFIGIKYDYNANSDKIQYLS